MHLTSQQLSASLDGGLAGIAHERVVQHLSLCRECRDRHSRLSRQDQVLRRLMSFEPGDMFHEDAAIRIEGLILAEARGSAAPSREPVAPAAAPRSEPISASFERLTAFAEAVASAPGPALVPRAEIEPAPVSASASPSRSFELKLVPPLPSAADPVAFEPSPVSRTERAPAGSRPRGTFVMVLAAAVLVPIVAVLLWVRASHAPTPAPVPTATSKPIAPVAAPVVAPAPTRTSAPKSTSHAKPDHAPHTAAKANQPPAPKPHANPPVKASAAAHTPIAPVVAPRTLTPAPAQTAVPTPTHAAAPAIDSESWPLVCGEVLDDAGQPVAGAHIALADLDLAARTDRHGRFCLAAPPGDRTLSVLAQGFTPWRQVVTLGAQTLDLHVSLSTH